MEFLSRTLNPIIPDGVKSSLYISSSVFLASLIVFVLGYPLIYAVGLGVLFIACMVGILFPRAFLFGLIILRMSLDYSSQYFTIQINDSITLSLSQLIGIGIFFVGIIFLFAHVNKLKWVPLLFTWLIFFTFCFLTLTYSVSFNGTAKELLRIFDIFLLFLIGYSAVKTEPQYKNLLLAFLASSILPILLGIYQYFNRIGFADESIQIPRIYGTFSHPNVFSLYLFIIIAIATIYYLLFAKSWPKKTALISLIIFYSLIVLVTYTRIAWIALFVFFFILLWFTKRRLLIPFILAPLVLYAVIPPIQERVNQTLSPSPTDSIVWRQTLWQDNVYKTITDDRWFLGYGIDTFPLVSESLRGEVLGSNEAHNDFIKFFVEGGVVGLTLFTLYLTFIGRILIKKLSQATSQKQRLVAINLICVFVALIVASLSDNVFKNTPLQWIFWILLGASLSGILPQKKSGIPG